METWTLSVTGQNPILSSDGKWIIAGHGNASITEVATRVSKVISKPGFVGGFYSNDEARLIHSDISTIYILRRENNWEPVKLQATYNRGNTYAVGTRHSAINRQATGDYNIILDDQVLVGDNKCLSCDTNDEFLAFAHNEGNQVYWIWVYDIVKKTYDKFKPRTGANVIRTNCGYTSYGYLDKCWIRTPAKGDVDITANPYGGESAACIINVNGAYWALTYTEYTNNPNGFCILRPIGDKKVITIPFGGKRPDGKFVDGHFIVTAATANGKMSLARIPLNEERKLIPPPSTVPPIEPPIPPGPTMGLPTKVNDLWKTWNQRFPLPLGEENIRANTVRFCEQTAYQFPNEGYGTKSSTATNPISKDTISQVVPANANNSNKTKMTSWDLVLGAGTTNPTPVYSNHGEYDTTNQYFRPVSPINHLGTVVPPNPEPPEPGDSEVLAELKKQTAILIDIRELLEQQGRS